MAKYLVKGKYTVPSGIGGLREDGGSARVAAATELIQSLGGKLEAFYFAYGDTVLIDMPDAPSAVAASLAVGASGDVAVELVPLITPAEVDAAVKMSPKYDAPGKDN